MPHLTTVLQAISPEELVELFQPQEGPILRSLVVFVLTLLVVYALVRFGVVRPLTRMMDRRGVDSSIVSLARLLGQISSGVVAFGLAFALAGFGSIVTAFSVVVGAAAIAVGLAANELFANLLSGLYIINEKLFEVGDWIEWEDSRGRVERIDLRVTRVRTFDNELVAVPNSLLANTAITNPVAFDRMRISSRFRVGYGQIDQATDIVLTEARALPDVLSDPEPSVRISDLGDGYVELNARIWLTDPSRSHYNRLRSEYITAVAHRLAQAGIGPDPSPVRLSGTLDIDGVEGTSPVSR
ncbi:mechanosensitive ion channel family protein [Salinirubellus salinus]|uniref:Mechanosensitive ion channel family protein n=1 Tax=Salinirubellus salinus TaxID=1364945 RepID=A0A9E7UBX8_9EURY|nr:mechanosensitive ion channel family protein [Salinirubellus salinus]UWM55728.1 mechanosensitive ion channel family protein [Salinirubellus salinus]